jgi:hypothetical protein
MEEGNSPELNISILLRIEKVHISVKPNLQCETPTVNVPTHHERGLLRGERGIGSMKER